MTSSTFQKQIEQAVPILLNMAREQTYSKISDNCKFILTEIKDIQENFHVQVQLSKKENDPKVPVALTELLPTLQHLYDNFYDINLHIYRATKSITIIDFRYYPKSSLDVDYRMKVLQNPPMLHCKVSQPPWLTDKKEKFDINWEHFEGLNRLKFFWLKQKLKNPSG